MRLSHHNPNAKLGDSFKRQQEAWRRAYAEALSLRERFPQVEQIVVNMTFTDVKAMGRYSEQMRSMGASAKAFFAIACPRTLCLDGGFDLDAIVLSLLAGGETASMGTLQCCGWVDPTRAEHSRCQLQMHYRIEISYEASKLGATKRRASV